MNPRVEQHTLVASETPADTKQAGWAVINAKTLLLEWDLALHTDEERAHRELATATRELPNTPWQLIKWETQP